MAYKFPARKNSDFLDEILGIGFLDSVIEWIGNNLDPEDVFSENDLQDWARHAKEDGE